MDSSKLNPKASTMRYILIKLSKDKDNLESSNREATGEVQGILSIPAADFLSKTMEARGQWGDLFKVLRKRKETPLNQ